VKVCLLYSIIREQGRLEEAKSVLLEWLPNAEKLHGRDRFLTSRLLLILGDVYRHMQKYTKSQ